MKFLDKIFGKRNISVEEIPEEKVSEDNQLEDIKILQSSILFDADWYCKNYGFGKYLNAAKHYLNK